MNIILATKKLQVGSCSIDYIIQEVRHLLNQLSEYSFQHCYREANKLADLLANRGCNLLEGEKRLSTAQLKEDPQLYDQALEDVFGIC